MSSQQPQPAAVAVPWSQRLSTRMNGMVLILGILALGLVGANQYTLSALSHDFSSLDLYIKGRSYSFELLTLANNLAYKEDEDLEPTRAEIQQVSEGMDKRYDALLNGDPGQDLRPVSDPELRQGLAERQKTWNDEIKPILKRLQAAPRGPQAEKDLTDLRHTMKSWQTRLEQGIIRYQSLQQTRIHRFQILLYVFALVVLVILGGVLWMVRGATGRVRALAGAAHQIAGGDWNVSANVNGRDEMAGLARSFNTMTDTLRSNLLKEKDRRKRMEKLVDNIREAVSRLASSSAEILSSTTQQSSGAQQQASAVAETVATVDEVTQTANQATDRAKNVGETIHHSLEIGKAGQKAVDDSVAALNTLKDQVEATAENIVALAEQAQTIGDIIASVNDIAEQTNLLALNAAIEASRAGEHGKGFSVVAGEVKALADQSKKATAQVRQILGEIQKATNTAVLSTEAVTKGVQEAIKVSTQTSDTINTLAETLQAASQATVQIVASAGQQSAGMTQIHQAMTNLDQVTRQNLIATRQVEQAAQNLNALGTQLAGYTAE